MDDNHQDDPRSGGKRYGTIPQWCRDSGLGRTSTYQEIAAGNLRAVKRGGRTLIDYEVGFTWLDSLPAVKIRPRPPRASRKRPNGHQKEPTTQP
jgi:hypothetical protein